MKLSLRRKLLAGIHVYLALLACVGLLGLYAAQVSVDRLYVAVEHHFREVSLVGDLMFEVSLIHSMSLMHELSDSADERARYEDALTQMEQRVQELVDEQARSEASFDDQMDVESAQAFRLAWNEFPHVQPGQLRQISREDRNQEVFALAQPDGALGRPYRAAMAKLRSMQTSLKSESGERLEQAEQDFARNRDVLLAAVVLAVCIGIAFGLVHAARLARAVRTVSDAAARVAEGDFSPRVRIRTGDEIESLANSFNVMTTNLQRMTERLNVQLREVEVANQALKAEIVDRLRAEVSLRESEARFRSVTQSVNEGIISVDSQGTISFWNSGAQAIFGYREGEILGRPFTCLVPEWSRDAVRAMLERPRSAKGSELFARPVDWSGLRKDQTEFPLEISLACWTMGDETFYSGILRDATERQAVDRMKNEFIAMVSHELRTPMNVVIGLSDLLFATDLSPLQREYAEALQRSGELLLSVIDDILDLSKIAAGKLDLETVDLDVRQVVEDVTVLLAEQVSCRQLEIVCAVHPDVPPTLRGDPGRLRQVLLNLITNAVKFTPAGEVVVRAWLGEETPTGVVVRFEITDTGVGIAPEAQSRLFQPFTQVDGSPAPRVDGFGMGLSISRRLVELMGGEIGVESEPGRGSRFWFTARLMHPVTRSRDLTTAPALPEDLRVLVVDNSAASQATISQQLAAWGVAVERVADGASDAPRVLLAEDSPLNQKATLEMLRQLGYRAHLATTGYEVLEALERVPYQVVLLDCQMPELDGFQTVGELRLREGRARSTPVIAMTASAMRGDRERCLAAGMDDYLAKPIRLHQLAAVLARWVPDAIARVEVNLPRHSRSSERDLARLFLREASSLLAELRDAARREDPRALSRIAHDLRGDSGTVGAHEVAAVCAALERLGQSGTTRGGAELISVLTSALDRASQALVTLGDEASA